MLADAYDQATPRPAAPAPTTKPVKVVVIDTAPTNTALGTAMHGRLMAALVARAAGVGANGDCTKQSVCVTTELGLPRSLDAGVEAMNLEHGGFYGYPSDIAKAIRVTLETWDPTTHHLVINLSIGWEPGIGNTDMVATAIAAARCQGALVLVAAGNRHPRSCTKGLTGPGYYGGWAAPTSKECDDLGTFTHRSSIETGEASLAYAVQAVDASGQALPTSRIPRGSEPIALDAFGLDAVVASPWPSDPTKREWLGPQSGSSTATALRSGQAAALWASHPEASAEAIMAMLPAVDPSASAERTRAVDFTPLESTELTAELDAEDTCSTTCNGLEETIRHASGAALYRTAMLSSWIVPQPDDVVCPTCKIDKNTLYLGLAASHANWTIENVVVTLSNASATEVMYLGALSVPAEPNVARYVNAELCTVASRTTPEGVPTSAWIDFVFRDAAGNLTSLGNKLTIAATCP